MAKQNEELTLNDKIKFDSKGGAILGVLEGPVADFIHPTRNGRHYSEELWENVLKNPLVQEQFKNGGIVGELDHPADREDICTEKVAIIMPEPPVKKNGQYYGKFNILDTPCGRIVHTLAKAGFKLGVSSRGTGDVDEYTDEVDPSSYEFTCFDVVLLPAVKTARMNLVTEGLKLKKPDFKKLLKECIDKSSKEDQKVMKETLNHLGNKLEESWEDDLLHNINSDNYIDPATGEPSKTMDRIINIDSKHPEKEDEYARATEQVYKNIESYAKDILSLAEDKLKNYSKYEQILDTDLDQDIKENIYSKLFITERDLINKAKEYSKDNLLWYSKTNPKSIFTNNGRGTYNTYQLDRSQGYQTALDEVIDLYKEKHLDIGVDLMNKLKSDLKRLDETLDNLSIKLEEEKKSDTLSDYLNVHSNEIWTTDDKDNNKLANNFIKVLDGALKDKKLSDSEKSKANTYKGYVKLNYGKQSYNQISSIIRALLNESKVLKEDLDDDKHICVICGKEYEGYGNNAEPVADGKCCDECNWTVVIPERIKQIGLKEDVEGNKEGEDLPKEDIIEPETLDDLDIQKEDEASECCVDDAKLIELLHKFLEKQGLELDGKGDEENDFVELYHEIVCPSCVSDQEGEEPEDLDIDEKEVEIKEPEVEDNESDQLVEQLQKLLKENGNLKEELKKLQTEKAVSGAKVTKLNEELNSFKSVAASAGKKVLGMKSLETKTNDLLKENESLKESLDKGVKKAEFQENRISKLVESKETLSNKVTEVETENKKLKESLESVKQSSNKKLTEARGIITKAKTLAEQYKQLAHKNANKYIELKARGLGISKNEIINRLDESYTLEDVDKVCESLKDYSLNISSLPFAFDKPGDARVRLREDRSKDPLKQIDSEYDDEVDDDLLDLAKVKKY